MDASAQGTQPGGQELRTYGDSLTALVDHAGATQLGDLDRDAIRAFLPGLTDRFAPATVSVRYRALRQFLTWAIAEEELDRSHGRHAGARCGRATRRHAADRGRSRSAEGVQGHQLHRST